MSLNSPTFTYPSDTTVNVCTDDPEREEYTPTEGPTYSAITAEPSISYSDYTVMVILKSTTTTDRYRILLSVQSCCERREWFFGRYQDLCVQRH